MTTIGNSFWGDSHQQMSRAVVPDLCDLSRCLDVFFRRKDYSVLFVFVDLTVNFVADECVAKFLSKSFHGLYAFVSFHGSTSGSCVPFI